MDVVTAAKLWMVVKPIKRIKEARQRRKAARQGVEFSSEKIEYEVTEIEPMLKGKLTYTGILATAVGAMLGWIGLGDCTPDMLAQYGPEACEQAQAVAFELVDKVLVAAGLVVAVVGRIRAARREKALEAKM